MTREAPAEWMRRHRALLGAIAVGVALRLSAILLVPDMPLIGDEEIYHRAAGNLAAGREVTAFPFRSPLYIFFCALILKLGGPATDGIRLVQILLEGFTILGIYLLAERMLGARTASFAAWLYALYPDFIAYSHYLWSETVGLFLLTWGLHSLVWLRDRPTPRRALWVGLVWGLASLNKPANLYLAIALLAWLAYSFEAPGRSAVLKLAAVALATLAFLLVPWSLHMSLKHDRAILVSTTGTYNLQIGNNNYEPPHYDFPSKNTFDRSKAKRLGRKVGLVRWIASNPRLFAERAVVKMQYLWSPTSYAFRHIFWGRYGHTENKGPTPPLLLGAGAVIASTMLILLLSVVGFFVSRARHPIAFGLTASYVCTYLLMITLTPALTRYRLPLMVFAMMYAGYCIAHRSELRLQLSQARTALPVVLVVAALIALWWPELPPIADALQQGWAAL